ncbi:MAG: glycoside hydrolase family 127 protein [Telluria sp.]
MSKHLAGLLLAICMLPATAAERFPLADVRLGAGPFRDAQDRNLQYLLALDPDKLLAPFRREAGLPQVKPGYGNWESSGLDGHMGGHYLSALALMHASTGDLRVKERLDYMVAELKKCQQANGDGYIGGIPDGMQAWRELAAGKVKADNFSVNGKWVPWYNLHKTYAGLRDAYHYGGNQDARLMLIGMADWALRLTSTLTDAQMQDMLRSEHGGMNESFADVYELTGDPKYLALARRFSHQVLLDPLRRSQDRLTGMHANTQLPKVIGFERIGALAQDPGLQQAAAFFWKTVVENRSVAIGGNSVREHFHDAKNFGPMVADVEGPETCNTYNMLRLSEMLFRREQDVRYADYIERALYNHILSSQHPETGGLVYFTSMRPNHYRVYSQPDKAMWCCVGSGIESHSKYGEFIYAFEKDALFVNLYASSTLSWRAKKVRITQATRFPDADTTRLTIDGAGTFALKLRYPNWVAPGKLQVRVNGKSVKVDARPGSYVSLRRHWRSGDTVDLRLPMHTSLEQMPDKSDYYAVLHGPIVLAAKTQVFANEKLNVFADDSRMGHSARGETCPLDAAPLFVSDTRDFAKKFRPVPGQPLTFTAPGLIDGKDAPNLRLIPFFRLHESRYMVYWPYSTPSNVAATRTSIRLGEAQQRALAAITIDQVAPGEQQPESDHGYAGEGSQAGVTQDRHWRHATGWFSYVFNDGKREAKKLRLELARSDAGHAFDVLVNGVLVETLTLDGAAQEAYYTRDIVLPEGLVQASNKRLTVKFVAKPGSVAGALYGVRLLRE